MTFCIQFTTTEGRRLRCRSINLIRQMSHLISLHVETSRLAGARWFKWAFRPSSTVHAFPGLYVTSNKLVICTRLSQTCITRCFCRPHMGVLFDPDRCWCYLGLDIIEWIGSSIKVLQIMLFVAGITHFHKYLHQQLHLLWSWATCWSCFFFSEQAIGLYRMSTNCY